MECGVAGEVSEWQMADSGYKKGNNGVEGCPAEVKGAAKLAPVVCGLCVELEGLVAHVVVDGPMRFSRRHAGNA